MSSLVEKYNKAKYKIQESIFSFGQPNKPSIVSRISDDWQHFGLIEGDKAKMINEIEGTFIVALITPTGKVFRHYKEVLESGIMTTGSMKVKLPNKEYIVQEGESYQIEAGVWREIEFLEETNSAITQFHPTFEHGWKVVI